ncbi:DEAD/DEAH box helicase family protein [Streptomyces sp. NPDC058794]|uniref:DEAD/DEAH box helicase family protein n=1 Tax=Streptomyces sp. NPDC058794 TaxID=3346636 RepID=UPI0036C20EB2
MGRTAPPRLLEPLTRKKSCHDPVVELPRRGRFGPPRLFPDQAEAVERLVQHFHRPGARELFVSATGTGKTLGQRLTRLRTARTARARRTGSVRREVISM